MLRTTLRPLQDDHTKCTSHKELGQAKTVGRGDDGARLRLPGEAGCRRTEVSEQFATESRILPNSLKTTLDVEDFEIQLDLRQM